MKKTCQVCRKNEIPGNRVVACSAACYVAYLSGFRLVDPRVTLEERR